MSSREASQTAIGTAYLRAAHQLFDTRPLILDDPVALQLLGAGAEQRIRADSERYQTPGALALRAHIVLRSRYAEDRLAAAVNRGVRQYVIVGAGFDTFALRQPEWAHEIKLIEIDHPKSQAAKRSRINDAGLKTPINVSYAEVDFEHESLLEGLLRNGISIDKPTLFSWLGVTMYLSEAAIDATLKSMAAFPKESEVVLTFLPPANIDSPASPSGVTQLAQLVAESGEPFVSYFDQTQLKRKLEVAGFSQVELLTPDIADQRYYLHQRRDLPTPKRTSIAAAVR